MPATEVVFYREDDGTAPAYDALRSLCASGQRKAFAKCIVRIERLAEMGHELRRPECEFLRDGVYELRSTFRKVHYRILYFFHERGTAVLSHLITKEDSVPDAEIDRALTNKSRYAADPAARRLRI